MCQASPVRAWGDVPDAVERGVPKVDVARGHVDLRPEHVRAVLEVAAAHAGEQREVLLDAAAAVRALLARFGQRAAHRAHLLCARAVDVGEPLPDQRDGVIVEALEVVGGVAELGPLEAEPLDVVADGVRVGLVLLDRVGVVEAQVAAPAEALRDAEVQADRLDVTDVQVAVGLGREARDHLPVVLAGRDVRLDDVPDEVPGLGAGLGGRGRGVGGRLGRRHGKDRVGRRARLQERADGRGLRASYTVAARGRATRTGYRSCVASPPSVRERRDSRWPTSTTPSPFRGSRRT